MKNASGGRRKGWWTALIGISVFVSAGLLFVPGFALRKPAPPEPAPFWPETMRASEAEREGGRGLSTPLLDPEPLDSSSEEGAFDCMISPNEVVEIGSSITGLIEEIFVERGDYVYSGQLVALLESSVERAAVRLARARAERDVDVEATAAALALSKKRRERASALFDSDSLSLDVRQEADTEARLAELELERAREDHRLADLQLRQAKAALQRRTIVSPISGLVVERLMAPGEVVEEETLMRIAEIDRLRVEVILPSRLFGQVQPGDTAQIVPEPPHDRARSAEVAIVDGIIDGASGTFGVRLHLPNPDHDVPAGLRCRVRFAGS